MNDNRDVVTKVGEALSELDHLFQEGVIFTRQEQKTLRNFAERFTAIVNELHVLREDGKSFDDGFLRSLTEKPLDN